MKLNPDISNEKTLRKGLLTEVRVGLKEEKGMVKHPELRGGSQPCS